MVQSELLADYCQVWHWRVLLLSILGSVCTLLFVSWMSGWILYPSIMMLACLVGLLLAGLNSSKTHILFYPNKLVKQSLFGKKTITVNGKTAFYCRQIRVPLTANTVYFFWITVKQGNASLSFYANIKDMLWLQHVLVELEKNYQHSAVHSFIIQRKSVRFGELKISPTGLVYKKKTILFCDVKECALQGNGQVKIQLRDTAANQVYIPARHIPNITTFLMLFSHYCQPKAR